LQKQIRKFHEDPEQIITSNKEETLREEGGIELESPPTLLPPECVEFLVRLAARAHCLEDVNGLRARHQAAGLGDTRGSLQLVARQHPRANPRISRKERKY